MSAPQKFSDLPAALAAYRAGTCRRWVEVDGWQIDLVQAAEPSKVARPGATDDTPICRFPMVDRATWDDIVARATAAWLDDGWRNGGDDPALDATAGELPPLAEPAIAAPPVECCRACGRPLIGEVATEKPVAVVVLADEFSGDSRRTRERKAYAAKVKP